MKEVNLFPLSISLCSRACSASPMNPRGLSQARPDLVLAQIGDLAYKVILENTLVK